MAFIHAVSIYCAPRTSPSVREAGEQDIHLSPSSAQVGWECCLLKKQYNHVLSGKEMYGGPNRVWTGPGQARQDY